MARPDFELRRFSRKTQRRTGVRGSPTGRRLVFALLHVRVVRWLLLEILEQRHGWHGEVRHQRQVHGQSEVIGRPRPNGTPNPGPVYSCGNVSLKVRRASSSTDRTIASRSRSRLPPVSGPDCPPISDVLVPVIRRGAVAPRDA